MGGLFATFFFLLRALLFMWVPFLKFYLLMEVPFFHVRGPFLSLWRVFLGLLPTPLRKFLRHLCMFVTYIMIPIYSVETHCSLQYSRLMTSHSPPLTATHGQNVFNDSPNIDEFHITSYNADYVIAVYNMHLYI